MADSTGAAASAASSSSLPPLPPGWTENKAPTGHTYYYNAQTRESTYKRPAPPPPSMPLPPQRPPAAPPTQPAFPSTFQSSSQPPVQLHGPPAPAPLLNLSDPRVANAFMAQQHAATHPQYSERGGFGGRGRGGRGGRGGHGGAWSGQPRHQPTDRPRSRVDIPGHEPWVLVYTKLGRRFVHNTVKNTSFWRIPEKLMPAILEMDKAGIQQKVEAAIKEGKEKKDGKEDKVDNDKKEKKESVAGQIGQPREPDDLLGSDYEEVEVTDDDEMKSGDDEARRHKRPRTEGGPDEEYSHEETSGGAGGPVEFGEDDIAFQLQAAAADYEAYGEGEWDGEGADDYGEDAPDGQDAQDGAALFRELLEDFQINPFSPWEKLIEEGKVFDDPRYTALPNMKARRAVWEVWSKDAIRARKAEKEQEAAAAAARPKDPRAAYLQLLQDHATPKLYWAEFKRKFRKEPALRDTAAPHREKDKEKLYRDYVARRKLPAATRKADLTKLLESLPRSLLHSQVDAATGLPVELTGDLRYIAVEAPVRDALVDAFLKTAGPP